LVVGKSELRALGAQFLFWSISLELICGIFTARLEDKPRGESHPTFPDSLGPAKVDVFRPATSD
jgi:hypothetical protein